MRHEPVVIFGGREGSWLHFAKKPLQISHPRKLVAIRRDKFLQMVHEIILQSNQRFPMAKCREQFPVDNKTLTEQQNNGQKRYERGREEGK
jgi:hypothetical protein